jgi:ubiquinone/menaquinone biosynthesis C-methylase UbiE
MAPLERMWLREMRSRLVPRARGEVLEIGVGTGANLPFYHDSVHLTAIDESADMLGFASQRALALKRSVGLGQSDVESLTFPSGYFDSVVASLVLCSVINPQRTLAELMRVLKTPGGQLLLLEHMRPYRAGLAELVDLAHIPWYAFNGRCHLNRRTEDSLVQAGFLVERVDSRLGGFLRMVVATAT